MTPKTVVALEQTIYLWSVIQNTVVSYSNKTVFGRALSPFNDDEYLAKEQFELNLGPDGWSITARETTNPTQLNNDQLGAGESRKLSPCDVIMAGDQILVMLDTKFASFDSRESLLKKITLNADEYAEQLRNIQTRSVAFFKLEYPNFVNMIKRTEFERKIEIAMVKKSQDLKPFDEKISELQGKRNKIEQAWNDKIQEFKQAIAAIKDQV